ncbi:MAG: pilus assembly protein TadG-related protein [Desulfobaccales bacterium]
MAAITIIMLVAFFALLAVVTDLGHLMLVRSQLQNAADAGALAGARALFLNNSTGTPAWATGQAAAVGTVEANKADTLWLVEPSGNVQTGYWDTTWNPTTAPATLLSTGITPGATDAPAVKVTVQKNATSNGPVSMTFGQIFGITTVNVAAHATAIVSPTPGGPFSYALFSNLNLPIAGAISVTGSIFSNNVLSITGADSITGAAVGVTGVDLTGAGSLGSVVAGTLSEITDTGAFSIGSESGGATAILLSNYNYSSQIASTAATVITPASGTYTQSGALNISGNIYVNGNVILNGAINDSGVILATGSITVTGAANISGSNQLFLYSATGNITINGATNFGTGNSSAILYAPNGTVSITGASNINGGIIANQISLGGAFNVNGGYPVQFLQQFASSELVQ